MRIKIESSTPGCQILSCMRERLHRAITDRQRPGVVRRTLRRNRLGLAVLDKHVANRRALPVYDLLRILRQHIRSEEHTSELQSLMRISYAVFCLKKKTQTNNHHTHVYHN